MRPRLTLASTAVLVIALGLAAAPSGATQGKGAVLATESCTHGIQRPKSIVFTCGDAGSYVDHLRWSAWGDRVAVGSGTYHEKRCVPDCAGGTVTSVRVTVHLYTRRPCPKRTHLYYRKATLTPASAPPRKASIACPFQ